MLSLCMALIFTGCMPNNQPDNGNQDENDPDNPSTPDNPGGSSPVTIYDVILYSDSNYGLSGIRYVSGSCLVSDGEEWQFSNVGTVSGIDKLTTIPWSGWETLTSVRPRSGVVAYHPKYGFITIFVGQEIIGDSGEITGIYMIYRPNFTGIDEPVQLQTTNIVAPAEGLQLEIPVTSKSYTPFKVASLNDDWCHAAAKTVNGMFIPSHISVSIAPNDSYDSRDAIVVVGSVYGKNTTVTVTQSGLSTGDDE